MSGKAAAAAWKRDNLCIRFPSARSIEETGLDSPRCREHIALFSPHFSGLRQQSSAAFHPDGNMSDNEEGFEQTELRNGLEQRKKKLSNRSFRSPSFRFQEGKTDDVAEHAKSSRNERRARGKKNHWKLAAEASRRSIERDQLSELNGNEEPNHEADEALKKIGKDVGIQVDFPATDCVNSDKKLRSSKRNVFEASDAADNLTKASDAADDLTTNRLVDTASSKTSSLVFGSSSDVTKNPEFDKGNAAQESEVAQLDSSLARSRWKRLRHTVAFASHMANIKNAPNDLLEEKRMEELNEGVGGVGAAAFEGSKTGPQPRLRGRKGMEGLVVRQDKSLIGFVQDFYVACLKIPIGYFLVGVFLAPVAMSLVFMPLFLLNIEGLTYDEAMADQGLIGRLGSAKETCLAMLNIFLYTLSLSTTFGGSPVIAVSPFCLLVANVNTLMAQFLFVFLSGAVFARMSQPSHPVRCSKKAIIRRDDYIPSLADGISEKFRVLSIRLVLTGPPPCELVDAKICLTFRIFITLPSGSMFCSTQDLEVVRPEVSYLRYGLMVRHIIDKKSPVYGHTNESLLEGDASFSLTVMGLERASMQPIFHLEDYFVHDGDVVWDADYLDFIEINEKGLRVLDHSKIDLLKTFKAAGNVSKAVSRMKQEVERSHEVEKKFREAEDDDGGKISPLRSWASGIRNRKLWKCMSTSFTRAEW